MKYPWLPTFALMLVFSCAAGVGARADDPQHDADPVVHLPADATTHQTLALPGRELKFTATAGSIELKDGKDAPLTEMAFTAYQLEDADRVTRPVTFAFNGGPGMASAWLQVGAVGPWRLRLDVASDGPSVSPATIPNQDTWLDFTDLVFIDPPGTGYSAILTTDDDARRRLWSVDGDIDALAQGVRRWLDQNRRNVSPKYILGESYGGFRGPRLAHKLESDDSVGISGLLLISPLLDAHVMSGYSDPLTSVDLLPSEVAAVRARQGPVARSDLADVEAYAASDYLVDLVRGSADTAAIERLTARIVALTGFDPSTVRRLGGRLTMSEFQRGVAPGRVSSAYDATISRADPEPREQDAQYPDPVLDGFAAPISSAMLTIYADKLNWRPGSLYHLSNLSAFTGWGWGRGVGRPEAISSLQALRSVNPHLRVLIAHGMFDLVTPYFGTVRLLRMLPQMPGTAPISLQVYPGGHMFYFGDQSRAALRADAKAMFDAATVTPAQH